MTDSFGFVRDNLKKYPESEPQDVVKLLYQSVLGCGHMVSDPQKTLDYLKKELDETAFSPNIEPVEDIDGGYSRINLAAIQSETSLGKLSPETLNRVFVLSAEQGTGTVEDLKTELLRFCESGVDGKTVEYIKKYIADGCPMVSHSARYREKYAPHYRVVLTKYSNMLPYLIEIDASMASKENVIVGIDGMSGSGKSTLAFELEKIYDCNVFHADDFFLRPEQRTEARLSEVGGNVDYERLKAEIVDNLHKNQPFSYRKYDCQTATLGEATAVEPKKLNIIEGAYSLHPYFGEIYDVKLLLTVSPDEQKRRILSRNGEKMLSRFLNEWIPKENAYFEKFFGIK